MPIKDRLAHPHIFSRFVAFRMSASRERARNGRGSAARPEAAAG